MVNVDNEGNVTAAAQGILQPKGILQNLVVLLVKNTPCLYSPLSHKCQVGAQATNATDFPISDLHQRLCLPPFFFACNTPTYLPCNNIRSPLHI